LDKAHKLSINENSSKVLFGKYLKGNSVFVYTQGCAEKEKIEFLGEFFTQQKAAIAVGCNALTVARCLHHRKIHITKDKSQQKKIFFSYSFLPLLPNQEQAEEKSELQIIFEQTRKPNPSTKPVFIYIKKEGGLEFYAQYESISKA
jgi:hypothetical protein